jgi:hypothetical protein
MIGGAAPQTVSATRMAILILRENIYPFFNCDCRLRVKPLRMARKVPPPVVEAFRCWPPARLEYTPGEGIFPKNTGVPPLQENEWLSGTTIFCAKA